MNVYPMKKTAAFLLAFLAIFSCRLHAFAVAETPFSSMQQTESVEQSTSFSLSLGTDSSGVPWGALLNPNQSYCFPIELTANNDATASANPVNLEALRFQVKSKENHAAIRSMKVVETENGFALEVKTASGYPTEVLSYQGELLLSDKNNGAVVQRFELACSVGYASLPVENFPTSEDDNFIDLDASTPVIQKQQFEKIDSALHGKKATFVNKDWSYQVRVSGQESVNLLYDKKPIMEILRQFPEQDFLFLSFPAGPVFDFTGTLSIDISSIIDEYEEIHVYSYYNGKLNKVYATVDDYEGQVSFPTKYFGRFVITNKEIKNGSTVFCGETNSKPSVPSHGKENPETGA